MTTTYGLDPNIVHSHSVSIGTTVLVLCDHGHWRVGISCVFTIRVITVSLTLAAAQAALANVGYITAQYIRARHSHQPQPSYDRDLFNKPLPTPSS